MEERDGITLDLDVVQNGTIKVHSQIINDLSSGIYSSPASCVKELINNSYDADATIVRIRIKPLGDTIILTDDGHGMNAVDFDSNFAWISKSNKRNSGLKTKIYKRSLIGKIGIGFIAVNEVCDSMKIISSKKGESIKFEAQIDFNDIVEDNSEDKIIKGDYRIKNSEEDKDEHYTIIQLNGLKDTVLDILNDKQYLSSLDSKNNSNYYNNMLDIVLPKNKRPKSYKTFDAYTEFIINLASYLPIEYIEGGPIKGVEDPIIDKIVKYQKSLNFKVDLDGIILKKPVYFDPNKDENFAFESFEKKVKVEYLNSDNEYLRFSGYFFTYDHLLRPQELNGVALRIKGIPIAPEFGFDGTFMNYPKHVDQIFRNWISGEIYLESGLENAMNIDRQSFRITHPEYVTLQNFLHKFLKENFFTDEVKKLYEDNKANRKKARESDNTKRKKSILDVSRINLEITPKEKKSDKKPTTKSATDNVSIRYEGKKRTKATVSVKSEFVNKFKRTDWAQLEDIFLIFEKAYSDSKGDVDKLKDIFYELITELRGK